MVMVMGNYWAFWGMYALVRLRGAYLEVDLEDMRSENRLLEVLGRYGALRLHLPSTKFPIHYSVGSQKIICLPETRYGILNRNQKAWANTDARTSSRAFYAPTHNQEIAIHEVGGLMPLMMPWGIYVTCKT